MAGPAKALTAHEEAAEKQIPHPLRGSGMTISVNSLTKEWHGKAYENRAR